MNQGKIIAAALMMVFAISTQAEAQRKKQEKINPTFRDKEHGFEISIPPDKRMIRHWEFVEPGEGDNWHLKITADYGNPFTIQIYGNAPDLSQDPRKYVYSHKKHAEGREQKIREEKSFKKVVRKKLDSKYRFGRDKINASHLVMGIEDENDKKYDLHVYCFRAGRNQWTYEVHMYIDPELLEKKRKDKKKIPAQVDYVLKSFRAFQPKKKKRE